jgi:hypothetical protein
MKQVDPDAYHVFKVQGEALLFDRANGAVCEVNDVTYDLLSLLGTVDRNAAVDRLSAQYGDISEDAVEDALAQLLDRGFFREAKRHRASERVYMDLLYRHRWRRIQLMTAEACNLSCRYCYEWRNGAVQKEELMPWRTARGAVDFLWSRPKSWWTFRLGATHLKPESCGSLCRVPICVKYG